MIEGYNAASYGEAFAGSYDDRYGAVDPFIVERLVALAAGGYVLELGVGTGRIAIPLAEAGLNVHGIDASPAMIEQLALKHPDNRLTVTVGDMAHELPPGPFSLAYVTVNTFFGLTTEHDQCRCFAAIAARLSPGGRFLIEAFVPDPDRAESSIAVRAMSIARILLVATQVDHASQTAFTQEIELVDGQPIRLRPTLIRYASPAQLDAMATAAGFVLESRMADWAGESFTDESPSHISVWRFSDNDAHKE